MNIRRKCSRCDLGYIIKDHITPIIQIMTNELPEFNFRLQTTKCLNTAITLMMFFVGKKGLDIASYCDTRAVIKRHKNNEDNNSVIMTKLKHQLLNKKEKARTIYYILLTDVHFPNTNHDNETVATSTVYFPGHVFILEKLWDDIKTEHYFYFYQSYINQYTLQQHIQYNNGLKISQEKVKHLIDNLDYVIHAKDWSADNVRKWREITFTNSSVFKDSKSSGNFFLCFQKAKSNICYKHLLTYLKKVLKKLESLPQGTENDVYGDVTLYDNESSPLTNKEMKEQVLSLISKINIHKKKS